METTVTKITLGNGLQVFLKEIHTAPIISHWVWYRVGSRDEVAGITGISHRVEHMQFKGTPKYPAGVLDKAISRVGAMWNASTYMDWTTYFETNINYVKIEKELKKVNKKMEEESKYGLEEPKKEKKKDKEKDGEKIKDAGRSIETMFRNTVRTHVDFSSMADTKANIMISVNTLVLTIIISIMVRKLDSNPHLVIPTAMLTLTSLVTLIYAILVTRPKVTRGVFTEEDIKDKKVNLLFFGNFHKMTLPDFTWGMKEMMKDKEFLYDNMIMDFYYLGQVLGQKYQKLRLCYTFFMYGLIISVIAFAIAFIMYPGGTDQKTSPSSRMILSRISFNGLP